MAVQRSEWAPRLFVFIFVMGYHYMFCLQWVAAVRWLWKGAGWALAA